ncbi:ABC transporter ATP-binding protein [Streptosporangium sp. NPDC051022]|uniref:ABC transporter ATP-binding protein n=1 Tax=Streptosporangium sp. NPDC051022 TaxID=3155752 RepID=UPI00342281A9
MIRPSTGADSTSRPTQAQPAAGSITFNHLSKSFGRGRSELLVLDDVNGTIEEGRLVSLIGPSGCGKSTLLRAIAGLHPPTGGEVLIGEEAVRAPQRSTGLMLQRATLLPWRTVLENVMLPVDVLGLDKKAGREKARQLLRQVGLSGFEDAYPRQLSGGMQQRASLCRLLVSEPDVLLLDEPFGAVDEMTRERLQDVLISLWEQNHKTLVIVTHSLSEAVFLSDEVIVMAARPGRIVERIEIDLPRPRVHSIRTTRAFSELAVRVRTALEEHSSDER